MKRTKNANKIRNANYQAAKLASICFECGKPSWRIGTARCQSHRETACAAAKRSLKKRQGLGICRRCPEPLSQDHPSLCEKHRQIHIEFLSRSRKARIEKGLCRNCGAEKSDNRVHCQKCADYTAKFRIGYINQILDHYGRFCACCKMTGDAFLTIDHVNNDGAVHRKLVGKTGVYKDIVDRNFPPDFQILCWNCNMAKHKLGKCPHQK